MDAYDTPSGDLECGDYAQEADGSYISNVSPTLHRRDLQRSHRGTYRDLENRPDHCNLPITSPASMVAGAPVTSIAAPDSPPAFPKTMAWEAGVANRTFAP
jgi:hypothetical protein